MGTKKIKLDKLLSSDDSDEGEETTATIKKSDAGEGFSINASYAKNYDNWRSKEELQKLKDKLGNASDDSESSSDETTSIDTDSEDEVEFFRALSCVRSHDPKIYDDKASFFEKSKARLEAKAEGDDAGGSPSKKKKKDEKPYLLKDHEREIVLKIAEGQDPVDDVDTVSVMKTEPSNLVERDQQRTYVSEQKEIKDSLKQAAGSIGENDDKGDSGWLKKKVKTEVEIGQQEEDYKKWLKGETDKLKKGIFSKQEEKELQFLRSYWNSAKLDEDEAFLKDFFLNKKYVETANEDDVNGDLDSSARTQAINLSEDEAHVQEMETFEHKYNFRFEEPDQEFVKKYPRTIEDSLRRKSTKRKEEREKAKQKKEAIKEQKLAEVQQYKALKRKEIQKRIEKLREISGEQINFEDADVDEDFDPSKHDSRMQQLFNEKFYNDDGDDEKPVFPYDEFIDDEIGPLDDEGSQQAESSASTSKRKRKRKKKGRAATDGNVEDDDAEEVLLHAIANLPRNSNAEESTSTSASSNPKPVFDSSIHGSYEDYLNEYFKRDFEDIVGGVPCRFKYRNVVPNDFGLTVDEILKADDKELNAWASLKKTYQYRPIADETYEVQAYRKKATLEDKKKKLLKSLYEPETENDSGEECKASTSTSTKEKGKEGKAKGKNKKKGAKRQQSETEPRVDEDRLLAYGINPKKYEKRQKFKK